MQEIVEEKMVEKSGDELLNSENVLYGQ